MTNSFGCGAGVLILALSRRRIALSFDTGPASVPVPGHGMADAGTSSVSCRARTWRKLPDMTRPGLRLPTGAPRRTQKDQRKAAGTRQPTQNRPRRQEEPDNGGRTPISQKRGELPELRVSSQPPTVFRTFRSTT